MHHCLLRMRVHVAPLPGTSCLADGSWCCSRSALQALEAMKTAKLRRCYFDFLDMLKTNPSGNVPYTPTLSLLYGLQESVRMLREEGMDNVAARHYRCASAPALLGVLHHGTRVAYEGEAHGCSHHRRPDSDRIASGCNLYKVTCVWLPVLLW